LRVASGHERLVRAVSGSRALVIGSAVFRSPTPASGRKPVRWS